MSKNLEIFLKKMTIFVHLKKKKSQVLGNFLTFKWQFSGGSDSNPFNDLVVYLFPWSTTSPPVSPAWQHHLLTMWRQGSSQLYGTSLSVRVQVGQTFPQQDLHLGLHG